MIARAMIAALALAWAGVASGQAALAPVPIDPATVPSKSDVTAAKASADSAAATAATASSNASAAVAAASTATTAANAATSAANAATTAAAAATTAASKAVQTVNGQAPTAGAVNLAIPVIPDLSPYAKATDLANLTAIVPQFVASGAFITQATMRATYPCAAGLLGRYARLSDMYGTVASVAICETDGTTYYWRPQRTDYATVSAQTSGTLTLTPFLTAPTVYLSATPTANMTVTPSTTNAWPGATFHIYMPGAISIPYAITLNGLIGGGTLTAVQGRDYILTFTASGWKSN